MNQPLVYFTHDNIPALPDYPGAHPLTGQPQPGQAAPAPVHGIPIFELVPRRLNDGTFINVEFVSILTPGDTKSVPRHKVTESLRQQYAYHYDLWKRGLAVSPVGTPLEMWSILTPAQVHELKASNIFTVEQLAEVSDANLNRLPLGTVLRQQARDYLESKKDTDLLAMRTAENQALRDGQAMLQKHLDELTSELKALRHREPTAAAANPPQQLAETSPAGAEPARPATDFDSGPSVPVTERPAPRPRR